MIGKILTILTIILLSLSCACVIYAAEDNSNGQNVYHAVSDSIFTIFSLDENNEKKDAQGSAVAITNHLLATNCHVHYQAIL